MKRDIIATAFALLVVLVSCSKDGSRNNRRGND